MIPPLNPIRSSNLRAIGFTDATESLYIEFQNGHFYCFRRVPRKVYDDLMTSSSPGRYFLDHIREQYGFLRVR